MYTPHNHTFETILSECDHHYITRSAIYTELCLQWGLKYKWHCLCVADYLSLLLPRMPKLPSHSYTKRPGNLGSLGPSAEIQRKATKCMYVQNLSHQKVDLLILCQYIGLYVFYYMRRRPTSGHKTFCIGPTRSSDHICACVLDPLTGKLLSIYWSLHSNTIEIFEQIWKHCSEVCVSFW